jgi:hypothetical protein
MQEMYLVGNRTDHYRAFLSLLRNAASWETATKAYGRIEVRVLLVWGDRDWARPPEREHDRTLIPNARMTTLKHGRHFLALDRPEDLSKGNRQLREGLAEVRCCFQWPGRARFGGHIGRYIPSPSGPGGTFATSRSYQLVGQPQMR